MTSSLPSCESPRAPVRGAARLSVRRAPWHRVRVLAALLALACAESGTEPAQPRLAIDRTSLAIYSGRTDTLRATVYDARGAVTATPVSWASANRQVAAVDSGGVVRAIGPGRTTLTATSGTLAGTVDVTVRADAGRPVIRSVELSSGTIDLIGGDAALSVRIRAADAESGIHYLTVEATRDTSALLWQLRVYCTPTLESGSPADGTWRCTLPFHRYTAPGAWRVRVHVYDWQVPLPNVDTSAVAFRVVNPRPDQSIPVLTELTFESERSNDPQLGEVRYMVISATDTESGMLTAEFYLDSETQPGVYGCGAERPRAEGSGWEPVARISNRCPVPLVASATPVLRTIGLVRLMDAQGNAREMNRAELERAGFTTVLDIRK